uniref:Uncharacterized protein n=1 Tax=Aplanochytrium stocchinoi TaxID=215587 RepID=A0A7S3LJY9_9STRA|mmetsp:Transcript_17552/g.21602  ORF Transcript_17552/g.21602 Transcript_17552/m.21602 type:complete len:129 (-) Transcript_17552:115-501(-)
MSEATKDWAENDLDYLADVVQRSKCHRIKTLRDELTNLQSETARIQAEKRRIEARIQAFRFKHESCKSTSSGNTSNSLISINEELYEVVNMKDKLLLDESSIDPEIIEEKIKNIQRKLVKEAIKASTC